MFSGWLLVDQIAKYGGIFTISGMHDQVKLAILLRKSDHTVRTDQKAQSGIIPIIQTTAIKRNYGFASGPH
ncbi:hypothetical protein D3C76_1475560 [compost metagenome]